MFRSIRGKMTVLYILVFGFTLLVCAIVLYTIFARRLRENFDESLIQIASSLAESVREDGIVPQGIFQDLSEIRSSLGDGSQLFVEILRQDRTIVLKSPQLGDSLFPLGSEMLANAFTGKSEIASIGLQLPSLSNDRIKVRMLLYPYEANNAPQYVFAIAMPTNKMEQVLIQLRLIIVTLIPFALIIAGIAGWLLANRAFRPINQIISTARTITAEQLHERLPVGPVDDEISRLSLTLNQMIEGLEQSFRAQKQFTADASHELRTPLTILAGEIEVALQRSRGIAEYQQTLQSNLEEVRRLQKIVDALLLLSKIDSEKTTIDRSPTRVDEPLIAAIQKISPVARARGVIIDLKLSDGSSENRQEIMVCADSASLQNVFLNLLDNALKFSSEGNKILCTLQVVNGQAEITVTDNGKGIPPEHIEHVFNRFFRVEHSQGKFGKPGSGLGLTIAKAVIEAHQGTIVLKSVPGQGTTARVSLPLMASGLNSYRA